MTSSTATLAPVRVLFPSRLQRFRDGFGWQEKIFVSPLEAENRRA
jgi:hypothetical protein